MIHVAHILEATEGGTRKWLEGVIFGLARKEFHQTCICSVRRDPEFRIVLDKFAADGCTVIEVDMRRAISPIHDVVSLIKIVRILCASHFDIVHVHSSKAGFLGRIACRIGRIRSVVYTPHVFAHLVPSRMAPFYKLLEQAAVPFTHRVMAVSDSEAAEARKIGHVPDNILTIYNGTKVSCESRTLRTRRNDTLVVGTLTGLRQQKDPITFVRASRLIYALDSRVRFLMVAHGPLEGRVRREISRQGLGQVLTLVSRVDDVAQALNGMCVFVSTSLVEGMSFGLLEAMAMGLPVVATDVPGNREVIEHEVSGILVPPSDPIAAAEAVVRILRDPAYADKIAENARTRIKTHYAIEHQLDALTKMYKSLAGEC